jgi:kynurenine formamidase
MSLVDGTREAGVETELDRFAAQATVHDLGQVSHAGMPQLPGAPRYALTLLRRHGDLYREDGLSTANELFMSIGHAGTHIDAIGHVSVDGKLHRGLDAKAVQTGTVGLTELAIHEMAPIVRRGVMLDIAATVGVPALEPATPVTGELLHAAASRAGVVIRPGDAVLVRTGWGAFWDDPARYVSEDAGLPGTDVDGARWLVEHGVTLTGADCLMYEHFHPSRNRLPVHAYLIQEHGVPLVENMNLESLATEGVTEFLLIISPLKLLGATASPVRPLAIV